MMEEGRVKANRLGALVGCDTANTKVLVDCLRERPAQQLVRQMWYLMVCENNPQLIGNKLCIDS